MAVKVEWHFSNNSSNIPNMPGFFQINIFIKLFKKALRLKDKENEKKAAKRAAAQ